MSRKQVIKERPVLAKEWTWNRRRWGTASNPRESYDGVNTYEGHLLWFHQVYPGWAGEASKTQTFDDFMKNGPAIDGAPSDVITELRGFLMHKRKDGKL